MAEKRKDARGRNLKSGEYYDSKNKRYMFRKMVDGNRITITAADLPELRIKENELLHKIDKGAKLTNRTCKMTLNEYFDFWLETFGRSGRKATTCINYKSYYETHIRNTIGLKQISKITKLDCQRIFNSMIENGRAHSTMTNMKTCLNLIFKSALDDDIIIKNPINTIEIPQIQRKRRTGVNLDQLEIFMEYVRNNKQYAQFYPAFITLFNMGLRIGEMAAITWNDVDFEHDTMRIDKTVNRYRKKDFGFTIGVASPKSKTSVRTIAMNQTTKRILLKHKLQSSLTNAKLPFVDDFGNCRGEISDFVFVNSIGNAWSEPSFLALIGRIIDHYNAESGEGSKVHLDDFCPHMARHTYTSVAYSTGADVKVVSSMLGHASTQVTLDTYAHLTEEKDKEQTALMKQIRIC